MVKVKRCKDWHSEFGIKEEINDYVIAIINIYFILHEVPKGINYFHKNYIEDNREVKEYILLEELEYSKLDDYWIKEYESEMNTINFRDSLKAKYDNLKNK